MPIRQFAPGLLMLLAASTLAFAEPAKPQEAREQKQRDPLQFLSVKLHQKVDFDFRRTPLQQVIAQISETSKIPIAIDGNALKAEGLTQNMSQTMALKNVTVGEALQSILEGKGSQILKTAPTTLIVIYDEKSNGLILSTRKDAEARKLKPYLLKEKKTEEP